MRPELLSATMPPQPRPSDNKVILVAGTRKLRAPGEDGLKHGGLSDLWQCNVLESDECKAKPFTMAVGVVPGTDKASKAAAYTYFARHDPCSEKGQLKLSKKRAVRNSPNHATHTTIHTVLYQYASKLLRQEGLSVEFIYDFYGTVWHFVPIR